MRPAAETLRTRLDERLAARDRAGALTSAVSAVRDGDVGILELYDEVLTPLLVDTGTRWQSGSTRIWEEHFATATVRGIVEAISLEVAAAAADARAGRPDTPTVLLACPPREQHDLGLRMLADRFALAGWNAVFLGTDTPVEEIVEAARATGASLVVLSASTHFHRVHLRSIVDAVKDGLPGVRVAVGGPAFALDRSWPAEELLDVSGIAMAGISAGEEPATASGSEA